MSNTNPQGAGQAKKGLHPLAWVAIGCAALIVVAMVAVGGLGIFAAKKAKDFVEEIEENPAKKMAETVVRINPDLELVESDDNAGTLTIRDTKSGKVSTFDYEAIKDGKLVFSTDDGNVSIDGGQGSMTVTTPDGETRFGTASDAELPDWLPAYPGSQPKSVYDQSGAQGASGAFAMQTGDAFRDVLDFYDEYFQDEGYKVQRQTLSNGQGFLVASKDDSRQVTVNVQGQDGGSEVQINYSDAP